MKPGMNSKKWAFLCTAFFGYVLMVTILVLTVGFHNPVPYIFAAIPFAMILPILLRPDWVNAHSDTQGYPFEEQTWLQVGGK